MNKIAVYIISWSDRHDCAIRIYNEIAGNEKIEKINIIYSDNDPSYRFSSQYNAILIDNEAFWGRKFELLMNHNLDNLDTLIIHADTSCENWNKLVYRFYQVTNKYKNIGVWAPKIDNTSWYKEKVIISSTNDPHIAVVAQTDGIVFGFKGFLLDRLRGMNFEVNNLGWGIDWVLIVNAFIQKSYAVIDDYCFVRHFQGTGYLRGLANKQMNIFLEQMDFHEKIILQLLNLKIKQNLEKINLQQARQGN